MGRGDLPVFSVVFFLFDESNNSKALFKRNDSTTSE